jgi:dihydrolipoamide dehydrogenase
VKKHYQLAVIGSGSGGREAAFAAADSGLKVLLIEKDTLGGTCLHRGCYPVRALRACSEASKNESQSSKFGIEVLQAETSFEKWLGIQRRVSSRLTQELKRQLERAGVEIRFATASFAGPNELRLTTRYGEIESIEADYVILATGSRPAFDAIDQYYVNSNRLLTHATVPHHLLIVGGGYIGCEFASIFRSLGSKVTLVEKGKRLLADWDQSLGDFIATNLRSAGVDIFLGREVDYPEPGQPLQEPVFVLDDRIKIFPDLVLVATGRKPNTEGLGLERVGINPDPFVSVDEQLRTASPFIFAVGDVNGLSLLDSAAAVQARVAVGTILGKKDRFSTRWIPKCIHTDPVIASIGWSEDEAGRAGVDAIAHSQTFRLVTEDERTVVTPLPTMVKVLVQAESRQILGVHVVGAQAAEIVNLASLAIRAQFTLDELLQVPLVHPSATEVFQECAKAISKVEVG